MVNAKVKKTTKTDLEIEQATGISRRVHEHRNDQINELPTGKLTVTEENKMIYVDEAGRKWRLNPDIAASFHQPSMGVVHAFFHSILDCLIFCVDFPVPNIKFISMNDDKTWSEAICNRYTGELVVDPRYFGTANFCTDCPDGMEKGALSTQEHVKKDVKPHQKYGTYIEVQYNAIRSNAIQCESNTIYADVPATLLLWKSIADRTRTSSRELIGFLFLFLLRQPSHSLYHTLVVPRFVCLFSFWLCFGTQGTNTRTLRKAWKLITLTIDRFPSF